MHPELPVENHFHPIAMYQIAGEDQQADCLILLIGQDLQEYHL